MDKATILAEGKAYIEKFKGKIFVIKFGGSNLDNEETFEFILNDIVCLHKQGIKVVVAHGGGGVITRLMHEKGKEPSFVEGLRVTDKDTANIADEALTEVNINIVNRIITLGADSKSIISKRHGLIMARKRQGAPAEDFLGEIDFIKKEPIEDALNAGAIPVCSPIGVGADGHIYNINADFASAEIAASLKSEKLILLTDVKGIMRQAKDEENLISSLNREQAEQMIKEGIIKSGMIPKARAGIEALKAGVGKVHIISGKIRYALLIEVFTDKGIGTEIVL